MRKKLYRKGSTRTKKRFLLFPKIIDKELRWLEMATWIEEKFDDDFWNMKWNGIKWVDKTK